MFVFEGKGDMEQLAKKTGKTYEMDMCSGPLFPKIVAFAVRCKFCLIVNIYTIG